MVGEDRPSTSFLYGIRKDVDGGTKPRHGDEARAETEYDSLIPRQILSAWMEIAASLRSSQ
jgi:hypothetical protein